MLVALNNEFSHRPDNSSVHFCHLLGRTFGNGHAENVYVVFMVSMFLILMLEDSFF